MVGLWEAGEKGVLLVTKKLKMHKKNEKMTKSAQKEQKNDQKSAL